MVKRKHKPPSRVRYESAHPTVTCRVSREHYARLQEAREKHGQSYADILLLGLGVQEATAKAAHDEGFREGLEEGKRQALRAVKFGVCKRCGQSFTWDLTNKAQMQLLNRALFEQGLVHEGCGEG